MSRTFLFAALLAVLLVVASAQSSSSSSSTGSTNAVASSSSSSAAVATLTFCQQYSGTTTNATLQQSLLTTIVTRAVGYGEFTTGGVHYTVAGLFNSTGPLYSIFTGQTKYRVGAPDYVNNVSQQGILAGKLVAYFGALFGCTATGYPGVSQYDMYAVHANMSITQGMETYFNTQLATTLLSLGVSQSDVSNIAAPALGLFNRCAKPIASLSTTARVQVCGDASCALATGATDADCATYYYGSSSTAGSSGAAANYAASALSVIVAAVVAVLVL